MEKYFVAFGALFWSEDRNAFVMTSEAAQSYNTAEEAFMALDRITALFSDNALTVKKQTMIVTFADVQRAQ